MERPQPWSPADATDIIREKARSDEFELVYTKHVRNRMQERELIAGDILHVLKHGFVYIDAEPTTRPSCFKYKMETRTPNTGNRSIRVVAIPDQKACLVKVITVMWVDE